MPISSKIDADRRLVISTASGVIGPLELQQNRDAVAADPHFEPSLNVFYDLRDVTEVVGGAGTVLRHSTGGIFAEGSRCALLAPSDALFGMARMYGSMSEDSRGGGLRVFRELGQALGWLGVDSL